MRGFLHGSKVIFQERGIRGFFQGFVPTTARQAANSATRFSSYTTIKQLAQGYVAPGEKLGAVSTFAIGGLAGLITVYVPFHHSKSPALGCFVLWQGIVTNFKHWINQFRTVMLLNHSIPLKLGEHPVLQVVGCWLYVSRTNCNIRMQSLEASKNYKNSLVCAVRIFRDEGVFTFWSGAVPRLVRLILSGGIVFTMSVSLEGPTCGSSTDFAAGTRR